MPARTNGHKPLAKAADATRPLDDGDEIEALMRPFYETLSHIAFQDADHISGISVHFQLDNPYVQTVLDKLAKQVRNVAETTKDDIRMLVGRQAREGWSTDELADMIREYGVTASEARATAIARTETAAAYSQGSIAAYQTSGVVSQVEWLAGGPDNCDICQALAGARVELGAEFAPGIDAPPAHPNCVCAISPIVSAQE